MEAGGKMRQGGEEEKKVRGEERQRNKEVLEILEETLSVKHCKQRSQSQSEYI